MRKAITGLTAIAILGMLFLTSVPLASATTPVLTRADTISYEETILTEEIVNDRVIKWTWTVVEVWDGDWIGRIVWDCQGNWHTRGDPLSGGELKGVNYHCKGTFTGTVLGKSGSVYMQSQENFRIVEPWHFVVPANILGGTGELQDIHGTVLLGINEHGKCWHGFYLGYWLFFVHFD